MNGYGRMCEIYFSGDCIYWVRSKTGDNFDAIRRSDGKVIARNVKDWQWGISRGSVLTNYWKMCKINKETDKILLLTRK